MPENELKMIFSKNLNHYLSESGENQVEVGKKIRNKHFYFFKLVHRAKNAKNGQN